MFDSSSHWDQLHEIPRFRPKYPSDHVVRFLMTNRELLEKYHPAHFLDIRLGAGRHTKLAAELGFRTFGIDVSFRWTQTRSRTAAHCGLAGEPVASFDAGSSLCGL